MTAGTNGQVASTPEATAAMAQSRPSEGRPPASASALPAGRARVGMDFVLGPRVVRAALLRAYERGVNEPVYRPLRIYALDPAASRREGAVAVVNVPYEPLTAGPKGCLIHVVDGAEAVDLQEPHVLLQQGLAPSPSDPRFRGQMVYAVCSTTYAAFRRALGRELAFGFDRGARPGGAATAAQLRVRPFADRSRNAYYDKTRGEIRFGYFEADLEVEGRNVPRGVIATCLSHDIVVHEMSHALLDGLRAHFTVPTCPDVLAFHEAFADLVAIFQRFTYRDVVRAGLRNARGMLSRAELLTGIAKQFAQTTGAGSAVRSAVGGTAHRYGDEHLTEPHELGQVLVAAVFEAFTTIFHLKTERYIRLATAGTGVLPKEGELPEGLQDLLADRASRLASQFLAVCIRAIDYCPPVDVTFGEYLRAVMTADTDLVPDDTWSYREAWIDAFRKYRIYPANVTSLSEDALLWKPSDQPIPEQEELTFAKLRFEGDPGRAAGVEELERQACALGQLVADPDYAGAFGLVVPEDRRLEGDVVDLPVVESIRSSRRVGPDGQVVFDLVAEVTQRRQVRPRGDAPGFDVLGGATVILDPRGRIRYVIRKSLLAPDRVKRQREFVTGAGARYWGMGPGQRMLPAAQPFRLVHERTSKASPEQAGRPPTVTPSGR